MKTACQRCRKKQIGCKPAGRFGCYRCRHDRVECLNTARFYATDFRFKHAPGGDHEELIEKKPETWPANQYYPAEPYYYHEHPFPNFLTDGPPWSAFYYEKLLSTLDSGNKSPYNYVRRDGKRPRMSDAARGHIIDSLVPKRWNFLAEEAGHGVDVLTCRRICHLYGILELDHPRDNTFTRNEARRFIVPGKYRVRWYFQFYETGKLPPEEFKVMEKAGTEIYTNPMNFPIWPDSGVPSYPKPLDMHLFFGFRDEKERLSAFPTPENIGNFVRDHLRAGLVDTLLDASLFNPRRGDTWFAVDSPGHLIIEPARTGGEVKLPVFIVHCLEGGSWKGNFRFAGVDLRREHDG